MLDKQVKLPSLKDKIEAVSGVTVTNDKLKKLVDELKADVKETANKLKSASKKLGAVTKGRNKLGKATK